jgi:hypothetical protein
VARPPYQLNAKIWSHIFIARKKKYLANQNFPILSNRFAGVQKLSNDLKTAETQDWCGFAKVCSFVKLLCFLEQPSLRVTGPYLNIL